MALLRIQQEQGVKHIFIASDNISDLATVELLPGTARYVAMGSTTNPHLAAGVARGSATSGELVRVITQGFVSGVVCAAAVQAGDRLTIAISGRVTPLNSITPAGAISGYITGAISGFVPAPTINLLSGTIASGAVVVGAAGLATLSGAVTGVVGVQSPQFSSGGFAGNFNSGGFTGTAFNTGRLLGRALTSGGIGSGIQAFICLE